MLLLQADHVSKSFGDRLLFAFDRLEIHRGDRIGLEMCIRDRFVHSAFFDCTFLRYFLCLFVQICCFEAFITVL